MSEFQFYCPQCGGHIQCDTGYSGTQINCPVCQQTITVPPAPRAIAAPVPVKSQTWRNVLVAAALLVVLAALVIGGWYGYSKIGIHGGRGHLPPGLVALWSGEGDGRDSVGRNDGILMGGTSFAPGKVGQAFLFDTADATVKIPAQNDLNVGAGNGFSIVCWVNPSSAVSTGPELALEWNDGNWYGVHFAINNNGNNWSFGANLVDVHRGLHGINSGSGIVPDEFQHLALTYDKQSGMATLYRNGVQVAQEKLGSFTPQTSYDLYLGRRVAGDFQASFRGMLDEVSLYNHALSASEIQAIYTEQK